MNTITLLRFIITEIQQGGYVFTCVYLLVGWFCFLFSVSLQDYAKTAWGLRLV